MPYQSLNPLKSTWKDRFLRDFSSPSSLVLPFWLSKNSIEITTWLQKEPFGFLLKTDRKSSKIKTGRDE
ncbi:hypothetical protein KY290_007807 [Solanum tuberosum]|uniref:Uncharacterized protein n=1 Tax=Solanum tuberosum TaxID=4113 RepID=A0ABQ7W6L5_SOLTU|nr:hypothetical protein KY290_007807 [Solanum tuberosum]